MPLPFSGSATARDHECRCHCSISISTRGGAETAQEQQTRRLQTQTRDGAMSRLPVKKNEMCVQLDPPKSWGKLLSRPLVRSYEESVGRSESSPLSASSVIIGNLLGEETAIDAFADPLLLSWVSVPSAIHYLRWAAPTTSTPTSEPLGFCSRDSFMKSYDRILSLSDVMPSPGQLRPFIMYQSP